MPTARRMRRNLLVPASFVFTAGLMLFDASGACAQWHQWGGPDRNFSVNVTGLADRWPDDGPERLWTRSLGEGYSTIVAEGGMLFTMYRLGDDEFTIALDAKTGKTVWEHKNPAPVTTDRMSYGPGPYATPIIVDDHLITVGTNSVMHCYNRRTGKIIWKHDLVSEYDALVQGFGFSSSPIVYKGNIILPVGRKPAIVVEGEEKQAQSLMAFDQQSGSLVWEKKDYGDTKHTSTYSSPILITFDGEDQLVLFMATELAGLDPNTGRRLWGMTHATKYDENIATPVWNGKDTLFCSSAYGTGARAVKLSRNGSATAATELWHTKKMRVLHGNVVLIGDHVYGSSGDFGPTFFTGINLATGKIAWRKRGYKKAVCLHADGKIIILDEAGKLVLATANASDLKVHSTCELGLEGAWATPTLIGKTMFIRDRKNIMALDLG